EVGEDDLHLASVVCVDGARRVQHGDTVPESEPRARSHLPFEPRWNGKRPSRAYEGTLARRDTNRLAHGGGQVQAGRAVCLIDWNRNVAAARWRSQNLDRRGFGRVHQSRLELESDRSI